MSANNDKFLIATSLACASAVSIAYLAYKAYTASKPNPDPLCYRCKNYTTIDDNVALTSDHKSSDKAKVQVTAHASDLEGRHLKEYEL